MPSQGHVFNLAQFPWRQRNKSQIFEITEYPAVFIAMILAQFLNRAQHHPTDCVVSKAYPEWLLTWGLFFTGYLSELQVTFISVFLLPSKPQCDLNNMNYQITVLVYVERESQEMHHIDCGTVSFTGLPIYGALWSCKSQHYALICQSYWLMSNDVISQMSQFIGLNLLAHADESKSLFLLKPAGKLKRQQMLYFRESCVSGDVKHYQHIHRNCSLPWSACRCEAFQGLE